MAQGIQLCFTAFTAFLLIGIDQSAAKCVQSVSVSTTPATKCPVNLTSLTEAQLNKYIALYDGISSEAGTLQNFGKVAFVPTSDGFTVTCQCAGKGDEGYLELATYDQFFDRSTTLYKAPNKGDGTYDLISSADITCDSNRNNILKGSIVTYYACYTYLHKVPPG